MPFDGAEFLPGPVSEAARRLAWHSRMAAAVGGFFRLPSLRSAPEPMDAAILRVLAEARGLIERREDWAQQTLETIRGERCAVGALRLAADFLNYPVAGRRAHDLMAEVARDRGFSSVEAMNDRSRHEAVLSAFDAAIMVARRYIR